MHHVPFNSAKLMVLCTEDMNESQHKCRNCFLPIAMDGTKLLFIDKDLYIFLVNCLLLLF